MSGALDGLLVWITRPAPALHSSAEAWRQRGAYVIENATLAVVPCSPSPRERAALEHALGDPGGVVVALPSPRAAENFVATFGPAMPGGPPWRVAALGQATAMRAAALGLDLRLTASRALGQSLAAELVSVLRPQVVVLPSSDRRRPQLGAALRAEGVDVVDLTVHRTEPIAHLPAQLSNLLASRTLDLVAAYSPSALEFVAHIDVRQRRLIEQLDLACLGPTTADRARGLGLRVAVEPTDPGETSLLDAVARWWAAR